MNTMTVSQMAQLWKKVLENINKSLNNKQVFDSFFKDSYIYSVENSKVLIICASKLSATMLTNQYKELIKKYIDEFAGGDYSVKFATNDEIKSNKIETISLDNPSNYFKNSSIDSHFTFSNFVSGHSNLEAYQASLMIAGAPGEYYNPLFIFGGSGLGKTHLLNAIGNHLKQHNPSKKILLITAQDFLYQYLDYVNSDEKNDDLSKYIKSFDVLLIDDIQMLKDKKRTLEFFFDIYQNFMQNHKQIVLTSDKKPADLNGIDARLVTRFMDGLSVEISKPDIQMCEDILKEKIVAFGMKVEDFDEEVIPFIASTFKNSVRELNGSVKLISFKKNLYSSERITLALAAEALSSIINISNSSKKNDEQKILDAVSEYYNISIGEIVSSSRKAQIVLARHIAMYLIRDMLDVNYETIGSLFSVKDHSSVIHAVKKVEKLLKTDQQFTLAVNEIKARLDA